MRCLFYKKCHGHLVELNEAMSNALHKLANECTVKLAEKDIEIRKLKDIQTTITTFIAAKPIKIVSLGKEEANKQKSGYISFERVKGGMPLPPCKRCANYEVVVGKMDTPRGMCVTFNHKVNKSRGTCPQHTERQGD